jgi:hypothetical protein
MHMFFEGLWYVCSHMMVNVWEVQDCVFTCRDHDVGQYHCKLCSEMYQNFKSMY